MAARRAASATPAPSVNDIATAVREQLQRGGTGANGTNTGGFRISRISPLQQLAFTVGADDRGKIGTGRGQFYSSRHTTSASRPRPNTTICAGQKEGQFDFGMVDRFNRRLQPASSAASRPSASAAIRTAAPSARRPSSWITSGRGKIGLFGSKAFLDNALINRVNSTAANGLLMRNIIEERYLKVVDQVGLAGTVGLVGNTYAQANVGYPRSTGSSNRGRQLALHHAGQRPRCVHRRRRRQRNLPSLKGTQQAAPHSACSSATSSVRNSTAADHAIPMEIPRVRYETVTKRTRTGNDPPVADAGPDRTNVPAGVIQLDGSASYDPDGDPVTYQWVQELDPRLPSPAPPLRKLPLQPSSDSSTHSA